MARGGYRPGAGRPKLTEAEKADRRAAKEQATKPASRAAARKAKANPGKPVVDPDVAEAAQMAGMSPLDYMLHVMRSPGAEPARRDRMAIAAAPFVHPRREGESPTKRDLAKDAATKAGGGRFAPPQPPRLVANNK